MGSKKGKEFTRRDLSRCGFRVSGCRAVFGTGTRNSNSEGPQEMGHGNGYTRLRAGVAGLAAAAKAPRPAGRSWC